MGKLVVIESPYSGNIERNLKYARLCMKDSILRGENPFACHLLYTQEFILDDNIPEERFQGIQLAFEWRKHADLIVFYIDFGISSGMKEAISHWEQTGKPIEYRNLGVDLKWI